MHANLRRGLLCSLFTGGLLVLGTTVASAADTTTGTDGIASGTQVAAPVTTPVTLGSTSLGLLGDSTPTTTGSPAGTATAPGAGTGNTTTGTDGIASGTQVAAPVTAPVTLGSTSLGLLGDSTAATGSPAGTATAPGAGTGNTTTGTDGIASGTQVAAPVTAPVTLGSTSLGLLGDSTPTTTG
ncbi:MAG: hypothetical protein JWQ07_5679, partial [Ramlibacter sp.]|nr:hypothetical protein [Ramlibacter sp.]